MKITKIIGILVALVISVGVYYYLANNEELPKGEQGEKADALATKMLTALNVEAYQNTRFLEWSFRGEHFYKWDKLENRVEVNWEENKAILFTKELDKSQVFVNGALVENAELLQEAVDYFNNDGFWLIAPYKVFEEGIERRIVSYKGKDALLITYTKGGTTPGDSYLWILNDEGMPIAYKMWVAIIPTGGMEASWNDWIVAETGAKLPTMHTLSVGVLDIGEVKGYNYKKSFKKEDVF